ncbi:MAG: hypothetical protein M1434_09595 [Chloroflexi bacterium]|nr:hypothetical protein [Chloroflexota bacterium]MCL5274977.1 hypothetical protein [Chloroflexota bacterium]
MKKRLTFQPPSPIAPQGTCIEWQFPFNMVDSSLIGKPEESRRTNSYEVYVNASLKLVATWGFGSSQGQEKNGYNLMKILFEYGKRHVIDVLKTKGELDKTERLELRTCNTESPCIFDPSLIDDPDGSVVEVEIGDQSVQANAKSYAMNSDTFIDPIRLTELRSIRSTQLSFP